jgi:ABC-type phosphate transport system ATPase subunit
MCLWYGSSQALHNINMAISEKSITALIGPSGCGKSTFLKTLNRMNDLIPDVKITGEICYNGIGIFSTSVDVNSLRMDNPGIVFTRDRLLQSVWGTEYAGETRTVDVHIGTLRAKLGNCGDYIETVRGVGYRMEARL